MSHWDPSVVKPRVARWLGWVAVSIDLLVVAMWLFGFRLGIDPLIAGFYGAVIGMILSLVGVAFSWLSPRPRPKVPFVAMLMSGALIGFVYYVALQIAGRPPER